MFLRLLYFIYVLINRWFQLVVNSEKTSVNILVGEEEIDYERFQRVEISIILEDTNTANGFERTTTEVLSVQIINVNDQTPELEEPKFLEVTETDESCVGDGTCESEDDRFIYRFRATDEDVMGELTFSLT